MGTKKSLSLHPLELRAPIDRELSSLPENRRIPVLPFEQLSYLLLLATD